MFRPLFIFVSFVLVGLGTGLAVNVNGIEERTPCIPLTTCGQCAMNHECGWCETSNECLLGDDQGPLVGNCTDWHLTYCKGSKESRFLLFFFVFVVAEIPFFFDLLFCVFWQMSLVLRTAQIVLHASKTLFVAGVKVRSCVSKARRGEITANKNRERNLHSFFFCLICLLFCRTPLFDECDVWFSESCPSSPQRPGPRWTDKWFQTNNTKTKEQSPTLKLSSQKLSFLTTATTTTTNNKHNDNNKQQTQQRQQITTTGVVIQLNEKTSLSKTLLFKTSKKQKKQKKKTPSKKIRRNEKKNWQFFVCLSIFVLCLQKKRVFFHFAKKNRWLISGCQWGNFTRAS